MQKGSNYVRSLNKHSTELQYEGRLYNYKFISPTPHYLLSKSYLTDEHSEISQYKRDFSGQIQVFMLIGRHQVATSDELLQMSLLFPDCLYKYFYTKCVLEDSSCEVLCSSEGLQKGRGLRSRSSWYLKKEKSSINHELMLRHNKPLSLNIEGGNKNNNISPTLHYLISSQIEDGYFPPDST